MTEYTAAQSEQHGLCGQKVLLHLVWLCQTVHCVDSCCDFQGKMNLTHREIFFYPEMENEFEQILYVSISGC